MTNTLLCCDWGTSSFRLRWVDTHTRAVLAEVRSSEGIASTFATWQAGTQPRLTVYSRVLAEHIDRLAKLAGSSLAGVPLVLSGMASASIGMIELPYAELPFAIDGSSATTHRLDQVVRDRGGRKAAPQPSDPNFPHDILLISGVRSDTDVMRGEETQLVGLYQLYQGESVFADGATFIMPGTHSKHITVRDGTIVDFKTYMTGELFALLGQHSILRDSVQPPTGNPSAALPGSGAVPDWATFRQGVRAGATSSNLLNMLFSVRTNQLFARYDKEQNHAYLSGLLIGHELSGLAGTNQPLILCSGSHVSDHYRQAAEELALLVMVVPTYVMEQSAVAGQVAIFERANRQANVPASYL